MQIRSLQRTNRGLKSKISYVQLPCILVPSLRPAITLPLPQYRYAPLRLFSAPALSTIVLPPAVFGGLLLILWTYKCMMLVLFQHKIIYMPYLPPFARSESLSDYASQCGNVHWREEQTRARDGTRLALAVGQVKETRSGDNDAKDIAVEERDIAVIYFQGSVLNGHL